MLCGTNHPHKHPPEIHYIASLLFLRLRRGGEDFDDGDFEADEPIEEEDHFAEEERVEVLER